ncbi:MAG: ABC transporter ATP-binding protein [Luteibaculum sp.]
MISLKNISFSYGKTAVIKDLNLTINPGECIAILGESGSGKSTLLNILSGLLSPQKGEYLNRQGKAPKIALVFQDYALFPNLTVRENLQFVSADLQAIETWVQRLRLEEHLQKKPAELSGGQQQRVAVARAMLCKPELLLLDEPFSNLDTAHKNQLRAELKQVLKESNQSALMVTHDLEDAYSLADKIAVLEDGKVLQCDSPHLVYLNPETIAVMALTGAYCEVPDQDGNKAFCRPEDVLQGDKGAGFMAAVSQVQFAGSAYKVYFLGELASGFFYSQNKPESSVLKLSVKEEKLLRF